jgi:hypothetical protein
MMPDAGDHLRRAMIRRLRMQMDKRVSAGIARPTARAFSWPHSCGPPLSVDAGSSDLKGLAQKRTRF